MSERAQTYRRLQQLDHLQGTAVTVQAMVFGNGGLSSGAGVAFSRDPSTGARQPMIDLVLDAQGEDVVSGRRTPDTRADHRPRAAARRRRTRRGAARGSKHEFGDVQDVEFTIEDGKFWILQTRSAKRTPRAALRIAIDLVHEGLITPQEALQRIDGIDLAALAEYRWFVGTQAGAAGHRRLRRHRGRTRRIHHRGARNASPPRRSGDPDAARYLDRRRRGLCGRRRHRHRHRRPHRPCRIGGAPDGQALHRRLLAGSASTKPPAAPASATARRSREGDWVSIDGASGAIYPGQCEIVVSRPDAELAEVKRWRALSGSGAPARPVLTPSSSA